MNYTFLLMLGVFAVLATPLVLVGARRDARHNENVRLARLREKHVRDILRNPRCPPDSRGPCGNEDCVRCYPYQRWFRINTVSIERRQRQQKIRTVDAAAALAKYEENGPSDYDTSTLEVLKTSPTFIEEIPSPWLHEQRDGTLIDVAVCWWDLPSSQSEGT